MLNSRADYAEEEEEEIQRQSSACSQLTPCHVLLGALAAEDALHLQPGHAEPVAARQHLAEGSLRTSTRLNVEHNIPGGLMGRRVIKSKHLTEMGT
jgi:hypothetical protein